jgi:hypothetical protein
MGPRYSPTWFLVQEEYPSKGSCGPLRQRSSVAQELNLTCKQGLEEFKLG